VELRGIEKSFVSGVPVLAGVDFAVARGEIHSLLGENGAGKSTLMNVLVALVRPDAGSMRIAGEAVDLRRFTPSLAAEYGIGMVHQHSALVPAMTVAENLAFGDPAGGFLFHPASRREQVRTLAEQFDLAVPLDRRTGDLSVGERQRAEILRVLSRGARILILDEPTAVLTPSETDQLFEALRRLRDEGCAVVFISHKLAEVEEIADRVTVLRRGRVATVLGVGEADAHALGRAMLGRDLPPLQRRDRSPATEPPAFAIRKLSAPGITEASRLREVALEVPPGEILGVAGIDGNGQRELEEVLAGVRRPERGEVWIGGDRIAPHARALRAAGLAHLSGDRETSGLIGDFTIAENLILKGSYDDRRYFRWGWLDLEAARRDAADVTRRFGVRPADPDADAAVLSGGNAQKLAVARELAGDPPVLVAVNPTRGLDVGSARFVHERLLDRRDAGAAVLLISTELDEVIALADRVVALVRGAVVPIPPGADRAAIGAILLGEFAA
jgi:simple sugar transport system ATP-binding protein